MSPRASMHQKHKAHSSVHDLYSERDAVAWYWRVAALFATWSILGGYLILPSAFDSDPGLRFSKSALTAVVVVLLVGGYATTVALALLMTMRALLFLSENIIYPALCSSALGLLAILYAFASSSRHEFSGAAGIAVTLTSVSTAIFAVLLVWIQRKISDVREGKLYHQQRPSIGDAQMDGSASAPLFHQSTAYDAAHYRDYLQTLHASSVRNPSVHTRGSFQSLHQTRSSSPAFEQQSQPQYYDPTHHPSNSNGSQSTYQVPFGAAGSIHSRVIGEDEMVSQQMARLLLNTRDLGPSSEQSSSTFHIDWRGADDEDDPVSSTIQLRARSASGSRLVPPGKAADALQNQNHLPPGHRKKDGGGRSALLARLSPFLGGDGFKGSDVDVERGKIDATGSNAEASRTKSREELRAERRKEIELGQIGAVMEGRPIPGGGRQRLG